MNVRKHILETTTLVGAAVLCALVSNALAARERKVQTVGDYPNALTVPARSAEVISPLLPSPVAETATVQASPAQTATSLAPSPLPGPAATATAGAAVVPPPALAAATKPAASAQAPAAPAKAVDLSRFAPHPDKAAVELSGDDVAALHTGGALFLDARRTSAYQGGHIAGARSFPVWEGDVDQKVNALFEERSDPRQQALPIVVYCSGGECEDSHMLAQKLWGLQFNNVYVYKDGYPDWQKRGLPVRAGDNP